MVAGNEVSGTGTKEQFSWSALDIAKISEEKYERFFSEQTRWNPSSSEAGKEAS
jgi:hypothetical protein